MLWKAWPSMTWLSSKCSYTLWVWLIFTERHRTWCNRTHNSNTSAWNSWSVPGKGSFNLLNEPWMARMPHSAACRAETSWSFKILSRANSTGQSGSLSPFFFGAKIRWSSQLVHRGNAVSLIIRYPAGVSCISLLYNRSAMLESCQDPGALRIAWMTVPSGANVRMLLQ